MNELQRYLLTARIDEVLAMDALQLETRLISDCCIVAADVAPCDCQRAVEWLKIWAAKRAALKCT